MSKPLKQRKRKQLLNKAADALEKLRSRPPEEETPAAEEPKAPESLSHQKTTSKRALDYQPHRAKPGTRLIDPRGRFYAVEETGSLRAHDKPRSRVKREREARNSANQSPKKGSKK